MGHAKLSGISVHHFVVFRHRGKAFLDEALALAPTGSPIKSSFLKCPSWLARTVQRYEARIHLFFFSVHCIKRLDSILRGSVQGVKIQNKFPRRACRRTPVEACSSGARLWNRSVVGQWSPPPQYKSYIGLPQTPFLTEIFWFML